MTAAFLLLLLLSVFLRNPHRKKTFLWIGIGLLLFFTNDFIANEAMVMWELPAQPYSVTKKYKLGIVLTGTTITKPHPNDRVYFNKGADRVTHTVCIDAKDMDEVLIFSDWTAKGVVNIDDPLRRFRDLWLNTLDDGERRQLIGIAEEVACVGGEPTLQQADVLQKLKRTLLN